MDRHGVIRALIHSEISSIDNSVVTNSGPAIRTRRVTTEFNANNGETMVLAGMLSRESGEDIDKVPFLGEIPVLGELFRSRRFLNRETELVIFVTPTVVNANSPALVDRVEKAQARLASQWGPGGNVSRALQPGVNLAKPNGDQLLPPYPKPEQKIMVTPVAPDEKLAEANLLSKAEAPAALAQGAEPLQSSRYRVQLQGLVLREGPDMNTPLLARMPLGAVVDGLPVAKLGRWVAVEWAGKRGWAIESYLAAPINQGKSGSADNVGVKTWDERQVPGLRDWAARNGKQLQTFPVRQNGTPQ